MKGRMALGVEKKGFQGSRRYQGVCTFGVTQCHTGETL